MARKKYHLPPWTGPDSPQGCVPVEESGQPAGQTPDAHRTNVSQGSSGEREVHDAAQGRVLALGTDSEGGYAVPYQLDGTKRPKKKNP